MNWKRVKQIFTTPLWGKRAHPRAPTKWLMELFGGSSTASGTTVNVETSLQLSAVYACVKVLAESVAAMPLFMVRRTGKRSKEKATDHPAYRLVHEQPNPEMTSLEFREMMMGHLTLRGNAFAQIQRDRGNRPMALWPLHPDRMSIVRDNGKLFYEYRKKTAGHEIFNANEMLHIKGISSDGLLGWSPIDTVREVIGASLSAQEYGARFYANDATPGTTIEHPAALGDKAYERLQKWLKEQHGGIANAKKPAILEEGMKLVPISLKPEEAQFLETRKFGVNEIARIFRVPPHLIQDLERATFSNVEQQSIDFVVHTVRPWLVRWEQALNAKLLGTAERGEYFFKFNEAALLRGDIKSRYEAYAIARTWGWMSANDVRELEDWNPLDGKGGDVYLSPLNMIPAENAGKAQVPKPQGET